MERRVESQLVAFSRYKTLVRDVRDIEVQTLVQEAITLMQQDFTHRKSNSGKAWGMIAYSLAGSVYIRRCEVEVKVLLLSYW